MEAGEAEADGAEKRDPRAPDIGFLCTLVCPVTLLSLVLSLVRFISFVTKFLDEVAATEPDHWGGTADRKRIK